MKIAIDVGHAAGSGARKFVSERAVVTTLAPMLERLLVEAGHEVSVLDFPELSNAADLSRTIEAVNAGGFDLCVSLHADCSDNAAARGAHVCCYSVKGSALACEIADGLCPLMPGRADKVVQRRDLEVLRRTNCVSVLLELGFVSNEADARKMLDPQELHKMAVEIADGVCFYEEHISSVV